MGRTIVDGDFEWDEDKAARNVLRHDGVTFHEAMTAVMDPNAKWFSDPNETEDRSAVIGMSATARVLLVVATERGERTRIISARRATPQEEQRYVG